MRTTGRPSKQKTILQTTSLILFCLMTLPPAASGATRRVPEDFATIQEALHNALSGDSVDVAAGTYFERLNLPGGVLLISREGPETTILNGMCMGPVISIQDPIAAVSLAGFTLREGMDPSGSAVSQFGGRLRIYNCIFEENIAVPGGSAGRNGVIFSNAAELLHMEGCLFRKNRSESDLSRTIVARQVDRLTLEHCLFVKDLSSGKILEDLNTGRVDSITLTRNLFTSPVRLADTWTELTMEFNSFTAPVEIGGFGEPDVTGNLFYNAGSYITHFDDPVYGICNAFWNTSHDRHESCEITDNPLVCDPADLSQGVHVVSPLGPDHNPWPNHCGEIGGIPLICDFPLLLDSEPQRISYAGGEEIMITGYALDTATAWRCLGPEGTTVPFHPFVSTDTETAAFLSPLIGAPVGHYDIEASFPPDNTLTLSNALEITAGKLEQMDPDHSRITDSLWVRIDGFPLLRGLQVWLEHRETSQYLAPLQTIVWEPDSARILLSFLRSPLGKYDLYVQNPNDDFLELRSAFSIIEFDTLRVPGDYATIQGAISAAGEGATIFVDPGSYQESVSFLGKAVRLMSTTGPEMTTITAEGLNSRVVTIQDSCGSFAEIHGFTITGGRSINGGGIRCMAPALIHNCIIESNKALLRYGEDILVRGGGLYTGEGTRIIGNIIRDNYAYGESFDPGDWCPWVDGYGGGISAYGSIIEGNLIEANEAYMGAGVSASRSILRGNLIKGNRGLQPGDPCYLTSSAGGLVLGSNSVVENNKFLGNYAAYGTELRSNGTSLIRNNLFHSPGRISMEFGRGDIVERNTFAPPPTGFNHIWTHEPEAAHWKQNIFVNILLGREDDLPTKAAVPKPAPDNEISSSPSFSENIMYRCQIEGRFAEYFPSWADSNLITDPLFCDSNDGDFRLSPSSPALPINNPFGWPDTIGAFGGGCDVVPILMWDFSGEWAHGRVELSWHMSGDIRGDGLHIDRTASSGGQTVRLTDPAVPICSTCTFTDPHPPAGEALQYTLTLVQENGYELTLGSIALPSRSLTISLSRPAPCPSAGSTTLQLRAPVGTEATLVIYDAMGRRVRILHDGPTLENPQIITWDGITQDGSPAASGIYFMKMTRPKEISRRMLMIR
ncbi:MAG: hypothetical protein KJ970_00610 [Candidatus Eisenbacteria bacterium]|uniref:Right handed beta helix domain-containing protein n=1 Tax=Eiseniibacteriota bacterium TaxID=2212470 RepID=A0A948RSW4_UNCEI|nr:hypothetical protein [Candidatus Eisenbacteria bacterium]MBU1950059.1 hypothetical protein [Candidatus Eisenbacteria bacterium]MBU2689401.1 hypothetical protein [Candidatus Eisenbacteria bacterium]